MWKAWEAYDGDDHIVAAKDEADARAVMIAAWGGPDWDGEVCLMPVEKLDMLICVEGGGDCETVEALLAELEDDPPLYARYLGGSCS